MKNFLLLLSFGTVVTLRAAGLPDGRDARPAVSTNQSGSRLTVELEDGSRLIGQISDEMFLFRSPSFGELKMPWQRIRSIEGPSGVKVTRLTASNGDVIEVEFTASQLRLETGFGQVGLPVKLIRRMRVSPSGKPGWRAGLVALWSGEGNGEDPVNGNTATLLGNMAFAEGQKGQAFFLDGTSAHLRIPESPTLDLGKGDGLTIEAWIEPRDVMGFHPILEWVKGDKLGAQLWIGHRPEDQGVLFGVIVDTEGKSHTLVSPPAAVLARTLQHVAMTYDRKSGIGALYINGAVVAQEDLGSFVPQTTGDIWISRRPGDQPGAWTFEKYFSGLIDELSLYNRALPASEIREISGSGSAGERRSGSRAIENGRAIRPSPPPEQ